VLQSGKYAEHFSVAIILTCLTPNKNRLFIEDNLFSLETLSLELVLVKTCVMWFKAILIPFSQSQSMDQPCEFICTAVVLIEAPFREK
jgi:hypothetical protein